MRQKIYDLGAKVLATQMPRRKHCICLPRWNTLWPYLTRLPCGF